MLCTQMSPIQIDDDGKISKKKLICFDQKKKEEVLEKQSLLVCGIHFIKFINCNLRKLIYIIYRRYRSRRK